MKRIFVLMFALGTFAAQAQQNTFLDPSFWKNNPDLATVKAEVEKGNDPSEANRMAFDAVVYAINGQAPTEVVKYLLDQKGNGVDKPTHDARTYMFWAANKGNVEVVEYLISKGAKVNVEDSHGMTPIGFAAAAGQTNTKLYDALIKGGADVKQKNQDGASLLLLAIPNDKDFVLTDYFISKGLSLKDVDAAGNTAFNYVARTGNIELMKTLVQKGVKYTDNAMIMATQGARGAAANGLEVFQYLESLNLKPTVINKNGENALHGLARKPNQDAIINYFLSKGVSVDQADNDGNTPFMLAAGSNRDTATVALLLSHTKNINQVNKKGLSPLAMAVKSNSAEVVQYLIAKGADIKVVDGDGNNLGYYLVQSYMPQGGQGFAGGPEGGRPAPTNAQAGTKPGTQEPNRLGNNSQQAGGRPQGEGRGGQRGDVFSPKMKVLQESGVDLAAPQKDGNTLYHLAISKNDLALLKRIERLNIDVNVKNKEGLTALQKAAMLAKDDTILKYLLSIGAKKDITSEFKETAYDMAKENEFLSKNNISVDFLK